MLQRAGIGAAIFICMMLVAARIAWFPPASDEALVAVPAWNLAHSGFMGTTTLADPATPWKDITRRTYSTLPGGILWLAAVYTSLPASLLVTRVAMAFWAVVLASSFFGFLRRLTGDRAVAWLATALLCFDYHFIVLAAYARVDMMTAALGVTALAWYVRLREQSLNRAVLAGSGCAVLACLTHPQGLLYAVALTILAVALDWRRLSLRHVALAAAPVLLFGGMWLWYVAQDPAAALSQLRVSSSGQGRFPRRFAFTNILRREVLKRYLLTERISVSGSGIFKAILLAVPVASAIGILAFPGLRRRPGAVILAVMTLTLLAMETFLENSKTHFYLIHMDVFYAAVVSIAACCCYRCGGWSRPLATLLATGYIAVNLAGVAARLHEDFREDAYRPASAFLRNTMGAGDVVIGPSDLWFDFHNIKEDPSLGVRSGLAPAYVIQNSPGSAPAGFEKIYDQLGYRIYRRGTLSRRPD